MNDSFNKHREPEEIFLPISAKRYADFYSLEMNHFTRDIQFYQQSCKERALLLELGCGTGRISNSLSSQERRVIGVDLSLDMLQQARDSHGNTFECICMDMTEIAFTCQFDHILIPYNTLNLLRNKQVIKKCLHQIHSLLKPDATLLLQLHIPASPEQHSGDDKIFQFQIFPMRNGGKLIKETLRSHDAQSGEILLEERYRPRPAYPPLLRQNFRHSHFLAGFSLQQWLQIFTDCGFTDYLLYGDYDFRPFRDGTDSTLLLQASSCTQKQ